MLFVCCCCCDASATHLMGHSRYVLDLFFSLCVRACSGGAILRLAVDF